MTYGQVTCPSNAATVVVAASNPTSGSATDSLEGADVKLFNGSAQDIYIGGDTSLTSANGFLLKAGSTINLNIGPSDAIYARGALFSPVLYYLATTGA